jgi:hypothetical protein
VPSAIFAIFYMSPWRYHERSGIADLAWRASRWSAGFSNWFQQFLPTLAAMWRV